MGKRPDRHHDRDPGVKPVAHPSHPQAAPRAVVDPDGTLWPSLRQAGQAYDVTPPTVRRWAQLGRGGWRFPEGR